jgi:hypothetical protein
MYAVFIFPYTKSTRVIPVKWVLNFDRKILKKKNQKCAITARIRKKKPNFDKTLFKKDLQNEEEGLYKIYIKEVFGKYL